MTLKLVESLPEIPDDLKALNPVLSAQIILVGDKAYKMLPLTEGVFEELSAEIAKTVAGFLDAYQKKSAEAKKGEVMPLESFTDGVLKGGLLAKFLSHATGLPEKQIKEELTFPQMAHIAAVLYEQNFDTGNYPKVTQGKVQGLLSFLGLGTVGPKKFAEEVLDATLDPTILDRKSLTRAIVHSATRCLPSGVWRQLSPRSSAALRRISRVPSRSLPTSRISLPTRPLRRELLPRSRVRLPPKGLPHRRARHLLREVPRRRDPRVHAPLADLVVPARLYDRDPGLRAMGAVHRRSQQEEDQRAWLQGR